MKAITQKPGESPEVIELTKGETLKELQGLVGGYVTTFYVPVGAEGSFDEEGITAWANDEGLLEGLQPNLLAAGQPIVGPVVFTGHDDEGDTIGLTDAQAELVMTFLAAATLNALQSYRIGQQLAEMF